MQETRRFILEILRRRRQATVDDIVAELQKQRGSITAVTVRHHLKLLQEEDLITSPELRRRTSPGRPQYIYTLTDKAREHFPNNYQRLAEGLLEELQKHLTGFCPLRCIPLQGPLCPYPAAAARQERADL